MAKWEYCKLVQPIQTGDTPIAPTKLKFLAPSKDGVVEDVDNLDRRLAQLGADGWELVSHTQIWEVAVQSEKVAGAFPVMQVHYLKREV